MATIQDYENASLTAKRDVATTQLHLRRAYDAALETTKQDPADFYVAPDRLEDDAVRSTFKNTLMETLCAPYAAGLAGMPNDPQIAEQLLLSGWFGFGRSEIDNVIDGYKENINFGNFSEFINKKTQHQNVLGRRFDYTRSVLDEVDTADVVDHVGIAPTQPDKITLDDKVELMSLYEQHGVVSPNALRDKPYM